MGSTAKNSLPFLHEHGDGLWQIDLDLPREGFRRFIAAWVMGERDTAILVDPGPQAGYETLRHALLSLGIRRLQAILLTHIHIDHAGATGVLVRDFPAPVFCHHAAIRHLTQPDQLAKTAAAVLGDLASAYGPITPVPRELLHPAEDVSFPTISLKAIATPGHAPHHLSWLLDDTLFLGEATGASYPLAEFYLRPATPPPFRSEAYRASLKRLEGVTARRACFGHYGICSDPPRLIAAALTQIDLWKKTITHDVHQPSAEGYFTVLLDRDPLLAPFFSYHLIFNNGNDSLS